MDPRAMSDAGGGTDPDLLPPLGPTISPADLLARHYTRVPGGILNALAEAAAYEDNPDWGVQLREEDYLADTPVSVADIDNLGEYVPSERRAYLLSDLINPRPIAEHEATHAGLLRSRPRFVVNGQATPLVDSPEDHIRYLMQPAEIDVRLAEAKRLYARVMGKLVTDEQTAREAWELYKRAYEDVSPEDMPTMGGDYLEYEKYPELMRQMMQRMPGVVSTGESDIYG